MWIDVFRDPFANLRVFSPFHLTNVDLHNDGRFRLVVVHSQEDCGALPRGKVLKVFSGTELEKELTLPSSVDCVLHLEGGLLALAGGVSVYLFKELKPYYKFHLKSVQSDDVLTEQETNIWTNLKQGAVGAEDALAMFESFADDAKDQISSNLKRLLSLESHEKRETLLEDCVQNFNPKLRSFHVEDTITCMGVLRGTSSSHLVLGTELGFVVFLDSSGTQESMRVAVHAPIQYLTIPDEKHIVIYCRDGVLRTIKTSSRAPVNNKDRFCCSGMVSFDSKIFIPCTNQTVEVYSLSGKKQYSLEFDSAVHCITQMPIPTSSIHLLLVALEGGQVMVFKDQRKLGSFSFESNVASMIFGQFETEEQVLMTILRNGNLDLKVLKRDFVQECKFETPGLKALPNETPPRTDEHQGMALHGLFQENLQILKMETMKSYLKVTRDGQGSFSENGRLKIQLKAEIYGLGPKFKLELKITNNGDKAITKDLALCLLNDGSLYELDWKYTQLPMLLKGKTCTFTVMIKCLKVEVLDPGEIQVIIIKQGSTFPVLSALIAMPLYTPEES